MQLKLVQIWHRQSAILNHFCSIGHKYGRIWARNRCWTVRFHRQLQDSTDNLGMVWLMTAYKYRQLEVFWVQYSTNLGKVGSNMDAIVPVGTFWCGNPWQFQSTWVFIAPNNHIRQGKSAYLPKGLSTRRHHYRRCCYNQRRCCSNQNPLPPNLSPKQA